MAATVPLPSSDTLAALGHNCLEGQPVNQHQQRALMVLAKAWQLKNQANQADYTADFNTLASDATKATAGMKSDQVSAALLGINLDVMKGVAGSPQTLTDQLAAIRVTLNRPLDDLDRMDLLLEYLLQKSAGA